MIRKWPLSGLRRASTEWQLKGKFILFLMQLMTQMQSFINIHLKSTFTSSHVNLFYSFHYIPKTKLILWQALCRSDRMNENQFVKKIWIDHQRFDNWIYKVSIFITFIKKLTDFPIYHVNANFIGFYKTLTPPLLLTKDKQKPKTLNALY